MSRLCEGARVPYGCRRADQQLQMILDIERRQQLSVQKILEITHAIAGTALISIPFSIVQFGSRVYGNAVPSSDVDVVCELPYDLHHKWGLDKTIVLERFLHQLNADRRCLDVEDIIQEKCTVSFRFVNLTCDLTVSIGNVMRFHGPTMFTLAVKEKLDIFSDQFRDLCRLVVSEGRRLDLCWNGGSIGTKLKPVHWVLMTHAWYQWFRKTRNDLACFPLPVLLMKVFSFYAYEFDFAKLYIDVGQDPAFQARPSGVSGATMWLNDWTRTNRNLADKVDQWRINNIKRKLKDATGDVARLERSYWDAAFSFWVDYRESLYWGESEGEDFSIHRQITQVTGGVESIYFQPRRPAPPPPPPYPPPPCMPSSTQTSIVEVD